MRRWRTWLLTGLAVLALACEGAEAGAPGPSGSATPPPPAGDLPSSMAALGDSITAGYGTCLAPVPCPRNSWATGNGTRVDSHYERIARANPAIKGNRHNLAEPNASASALAGQAERAVATKAGYVTVLIGANDACRATIADMTPVQTFRTRVDTAFATLRQGLPQARVLVLSVPDVYRVWEAGRGSRAAVTAWSVGICPSLLARPGSGEQADVERRAAFRDRIRAYNAQLTEACRAYGPRCRTDGGAVHRTTFGLDLLSTQDFFHPNAAGQSRIAQVSYPERFGW